LGPIPNPQSPIPNPQSPNPITLLLFNLILNNIKQILILTLFKKPIFYILTH
jgi:hypothetical protein